jgi:hypothetical protein
MMAEFERGGVGVSKVVRQASSVLTLAVAETFAKGACIDLGVPGCAVDPGDSA